MAYEMSNGLWSRWPETIEKAVALRKNKYGGAIHCEHCGSLAAKFVTTGHCMMCQRIKMEQIRWFSSRGMGVELPKNALKPVSNVDWGQEIFNAVKLVSAGSHYVGEHPCKRHGHVNIVDRQTMQCHECTKMLTPRNQALKEGAKWYVPGQPCAECHTVALRDPVTSECSSCGHVPTKGPKKKHIDGDESTVDNRETPDTVMMRDNPDMILSKDDSQLYGFKVHRTGEPCRRGHKAWRYNSTGNCIDCLRMDKDGK